MSKRKTLAIGCSSVLGLLGLALGGGWLYLQSDAGERRVEGLLEQTIRDSLATGAIEVGELDLKGDHLILTDVTVDGAENDDVLVIPRIEAEVRLRSLVNKTVHIERARIVRPELVLHRLKDGAFDLPVFTPGPEPTQPTPTTFMPMGLQLDVDDLLLTAGSVLLPDDEVFIDGLALAADADVTETTIDIDLEQLDWTVRQPDLGSGLLSASAHIDREDLTSLDLALQHAGIVLDVQGHVDALLGDALAPDLTLEGVVPRDSLLRFADVFEVELPAPMREGTDLTLDAGITGPLESAVLRMEVGRDDVDGPLLAISGSGRLTPPLELGGQLVAPKLGELASEGVPFSSGTASVLFDARQADDAWFLTADLTSTGTSVPDAADIRRLTAHVEGQVAPTPDLSYEVDVSDLGVPAAPIPAAFHIVADGRFVGDHLTSDLHAQELRHEEPIALDTAFDLDTAALEVAIDRLQLRLTSDHALQLDEPITARLQPDDLAMDGRLLALRDDDPSGAIGFDVTVLHGETAASLGIHTLDVAPILAAAQRLAADPLPAVEGRLDGQASVVIGAQPPVVAVELELVGLVVPEAVRNVDLDLDADLADDRLTATLAVTDGSDRLVFVDTSLPMEHAGFVPACTTGMETVVTLDPTDTTALARLVDALPALEEEVRLSARLGAIGNPCDPTLELTAEADTRLLDQTVALDLLATDDPEQRALQATLDVQFAGDPAVQAVFDAPHPAPDELLAAADPIARFEDWTTDLRVLDVPAARLSPMLVGTVGAQARVGGDGAWITTTDGGVQWNDPGTEELTVDRVMASWTTLKDAVLADLLLVVGDQPLEAQAEAGLRKLQRGDPTTPIALQIPRAKVPLAVLADLSLGWVVDATGSLIVEASVDGTLDDPTASGAIEIDDGDLLVPETGIRYDDLEVLVTFVDDHADLDVRVDTTPRYARFRDTSTHRYDLTAKGSITLEDDLGVVPDVTVEMEDFWAMATDLALVRIGGGLTASGHATDIRVRGDIDVEEGRLDIPRYVLIPTASTTLDSDIVFAGTRPEAFAVETSDGPSPLDVLDLEVDVSLDRRTRARVTLPLAADAGRVGALGDVSVDATVEGDVTVALRDGEPDVIGSLDITGDASLLTASFDIEKGSVAFIGADVANPTFDFTLGREGNGGDVTAVVRGTPQDLRIESLTSSQGLSDADILAQFLFGRPLSELGEGEAGTASAAVQQALLSVAGSSVESALGVSVVDSVDYGDDGLSLGWSVGGDGFLTVNLNPTADEQENVAEVTLSWLLDQMTEAELTTGDAGQTSAWLLLERRY